MYIEREALIQAMRMMPIPKQAIQNDWFGAVTAGVNAEIKLASEFPAADVAPVVRCKDCKHYRNSGCPMYFEEEVEWDDDGYLEYDTIIHDHAADNAFCSYGERRETDGH